MAMSIKSVEVERLAREVAERTGESLTGAIHKALEERLRRLKVGRHRAAVLEQLDEILNRVDRLPIVDSRAPDEILGYDDQGIPH